MALRLLIAGGGTGGHLFPGIAIAEEVKRRDREAAILFVGSPFGIETQAVPKAGFELALLTISGLRRTGLWRRLLALARLPLALVQALKVVRAFRPHAALSVGGYAAGPAVLAARLTGVPTFVVEQNAVPGLTNRILAKMSRLVFVALPTRGFARAKIRELGNPVRASLAEVGALPYSPQSPPRLLVLGGSQGATALNDLMLRMAPRLEGKWRVVHQTGAKEHTRVAEGYVERKGFAAHAFIDDMAQAYREADLVLSRAGATTLAELNVCGRPAVLVPYPFAVDDHQTANAKVLQARGAALHLPQNDLTPETLLATLTILGEDPARLRQMAACSRALGRPQAAAAIVDHVLAATGGAHVSR